MQAEIARRKEVSRPNTCGSVFSSKIVCGDCGGYYGPKVWNSNRPNRKIIWRCNDKYKHELHCQTPHITEEEIRVQFVEAFNRLLGMKEQVIADCRLARESLRDCSSLEQEIADLRKEQEKVAELARIAILEYVSVAEGGVDALQEEYLAKHDALAQQIVQLESECRRRVEKCDLIAKFIRTLAKQETVIDAFDERLFVAVVDHAAVNRNGSMTFLLIDGSRYCQGEFAISRHSTNELSHLR
ncbi:MAG: zinc ribbon domain-containing protein [Eubacteriales bacterium]|nr:zinc ribbon domain-containing protein [Eubacteriales bacterium]